MRTISDVDAAYHGLQSFSNWVQDYETALINASLRNPAYAEKGITFVGEFMGQFTGEHADYLRAVRHSLSEMLCAAGRQDEGEKVALSLVEECPGRCGGYVAMSDALGYRVKAGDAGARRLQIEWLEKALLKATDAGEFDIKDRIKWLQDKERRR